MLIITIRTDKPEAEIGLFDNNQRLAYEIWPAHRQLANTIHSKIDQILEFQGSDFKDVNGIVCFQGPGSFTGLRIGLTVGNALSYGLSIPIVATRGSDWQKTGIKKLLNGESNQIALPSYGAPVHIT